MGASSDKSLSPPLGSVSAGGVAALLCFVLKEESGEQVNLSSLSPAQDLDSGH